MLAQVAEFVQSVDFTEKGKERRREEKIFGTTQSVENVFTRGKGFDLCLFPKVNGFCWWHLHP